MQFGSIARVGSVRLACGYAEPISRTITPFGLCRAFGHSVRTMHRGDRVNVEQRPALPRLVDGSVQYAAFNVH
ncbi:unnamed protein product [Leptosia nina]|uniref:Uncharacterized protein n=1 Tax=Leptosia nina TaxID=320188 RepID=A0AAV1JQB9_9NEOP